jgi:hypothetical protein
LIFAIERGHRGKESNDDPEYHAGCCDESFSFQGYLTSVMLSAGG